PDIALSTDIIVGFPGETYKDYLETVKVLKEVEYDQVFAFKYSPRPGTPAAQMEMTEDPEDVSKRLSDLINMQKEITFKKNREYENKVVEVLVEEQKEEELVGRTRTNKLVHLKGGHNLLGELVKVKISKVNRFSLEGELLQQLV
ncbi:MAG TPA: TRAM domain-containing protein, partial [Persephonella sp.]|nr:TRAM domain-containing protein [Persephonella sp.]